jgi:Uma2 family endonuclease
MSESTTSQPMTIDEFEQHLLDGDRWIELANGHLRRLNPPDDAHGDVVRNLARSLATCLKKSQEVYACFELPLVLDRVQPTVRCPAVSCFRFVPGERFAETDKVLSDSCPALVIEIASSNERRQGMSDRVNAYFDWGVESLVVIDSVMRNVHHFPDQYRPRLLKEPQVLDGLPMLAGFSIRVSELFKQPTWMNVK